MRALLLAVLLATPASAESWAADASAEAAALLAAPAPVSTLPGRGLHVWRGAATTVLVSPVVASDPFDRAVVSWNATGPALVELEAAGAWHVMGRWGPRPRSESNGRVVVDTLRLPAAAAAFRFRITPEPGTVVSLVAVTRWLDAERLGDAGRASPAWGRALPVPQRSQTTEAVDAARVCSPTSLAMVLQTYGVNKPTREVALGVYDHGAALYGNWSFNVAYAHQVSGMTAYVARLGFEEAEAEILAGRPVVISHNWNRGELTGAPISETDGHLIVIVGFDARGDVVVNDPAARPGTVRRTYRRAEIARSWLRNGDGIAYILRHAGTR